MTKESINKLDVTWAHIGRLVTHWEQIENDLAYIYHILCETNNGASATCYGTLLSFHVKLQFLQIAADLYFVRSSKLKTIINGIIKQAAQVSKLCNDIIHAGLPRTQLTNTNDPIIYPAPYQMKKWKNDEPKYYKTPSDIIYDSNDVMIFNYDVERALKQLLAFDEKRQRQHFLQMRRKILPE